MFFTVNPEYYDAVSGQEVVKVAEVNLKTKVCEGIVLYGTDSMRYTICRHADDKITLYDAGLDSFPIHGSAAVLHHHLVRAHRPERSVRRAPMVRVSHSQVLVAMARSQVVVAGLRCPRH